MDEPTGDLLIKGKPGKSSLVYKRTDPISAAAGLRGGPLRTAVVGGKIIVLTKTLDVFDAGTGTWSSTQPSSPDFNVLAVAGSKVVAAGGTTAAVYDASAGQWTNVGTISSVDRYYDVGLGAGTKVLFAGGGAALCCNAGVYPISAEIYDVSTGQVINSQLSRGRTSVAGGAAGNKILIAGGASIDSFACKVVDIYDVSTGQWSVSYLSVPRKRITTAVVGSKILFAGGIDYGQVVSDVVDIYDASTGQWSVGHLSVPRVFSAAAVSGNLAFFGGGGAYNGDGRFSNAVDIYNATTNQWTSAQLSEPRYFIAAAAVGTKVVFSGGFGVKGYPGDIWGFGDVEGRKIMDIYDVNTQQWSTDSLKTGKGFAASAAAGNKLLVAGGYQGMFDLAPGYYSDTSLPVYAADLFELKAK